MRTDTSPFATVEREFRRLAQRADMAVDGDWVGCDQSLTLPELRDRLLSPSVDYDARDLALREIAALARQDEHWMVALAGLLLPGLRRSVRLLTASCPDLAPDVESESLVALIEAVHAMPPDASRVAGRLVRAAGFRAVRFIGAELAFSANCDLGADITLGAEDDRGLLATAVLEGVISENDAELIAETRLGRVSLAEYAAEHLITDDVAQKRRAKAESRLRE